MNADLDATDILRRPEDGGTTSVSSGSGPLERHVPKSTLPDRKRPAHGVGLEVVDRSNIYFVTVCTSDRRPLLANASAQNVLLSAWRMASSFIVGRYVIMPDHVHLFCAPAVYPPEPLTRWVAYWKSISARHWSNADGTKLWQRDFWDRQLRSGESYSEKWDYVRNNPVRARLVRNPEEWKSQGELEMLRWHC